MLALLCVLDGLLSAELQTCVFLEKEETSLSTVYCVQRLKPANATMCQPWWMLPAGGPVFWLVICRDGLRDRTDPWVSLLDRCSAESSLGSFTLATSTALGLSAAGQGTSLSLLHFPGCIFPIFVSTPSPHLSSSLKPSVFWVLYFFYFSIIVNTWYYISSDLQHSD